MMVSDTVLCDLVFDCLSVVLDTVVFLSRNYVIMTIYFSAVSVFVCMVYFAELAGNYFVTLRHIGIVHARP